MSEGLETQIVQIEAPIPERESLFAMLWKRITGLLIFNSVFATLFEHIQWKMGLPSHQMLQLASGTFVGGSIIWLAYEILRYFVRTRADQKIVQRMINHEMNTGALRVELLTENIGVVKLQSEVRQELTQEHYRALHKQIDDLDGLSDVFTASVIKRGILSPAWAGMLVGAMHHESSMNLPPRPAESLVRFGTDDTSRYVLRCLNKRLPDLQRISTQMNLDLEICHKIPTTF